MSDLDRDRWNARYRGGAGPAREPVPFLAEVAAELPTEGRALDVAGGSGRNALWLARRGLSVTLVDVSDEALRLASEAARKQELALSVQQTDLEEAGLPPGPWDLIVITNYLWRPLFAAVPEVLARGGVFVFVQPTRSNLERHPKPSARFLLGDGELPGLIQGLETLRYEEAWSEAGRHEARLLARHSRRGDRAS